MPKPSSAQTLDPLTPVLEKLGETWSTVATCGADFEIEGVAYRMRVSPDSLEFYQMQPNKIWKQIANYKKEK